MAEMLRVDEALDHLDLAGHMLGAEFGCGNAMFTMALARRLNQGKVYAVDIQEEKLSALRGRMQVEKVRNVSLILCDLEKSKATGLAAGSLDVVLIPNMLFQSQNPHAILEEGIRVLKSGGQMLVIDWLKEGPFSPKQGMIAPQTMKELAQDTGLSFQKEFAAGDYHYALVFIKK